METQIYLCIHLSSSLSWLHTVHVGARRESVSRACFGCFLLIQPPLIYFPLWYIILNRLRKGINILISTPGRLVDHIKSTKNIHFRRIQWLILDEADRWASPRSMNSRRRGLPLLASLQSLLCMQNKIPSLESTESWIWVLKRISQWYSTP